jgi:hypothetical protein
MDEWDKDPAVQAMRRVFSGMEACLVQILERLTISPYDHRIRGWLETAGAIVRERCRRSGLIDFGF